jgi:hypothetical protein
MSWNSGAVPATCHCRDCDAPSEPVCLGCNADDVPLKDDYCEMCHWTEDETCEAWAARVATRRPK